MEFLDVLRLGVTYPQKALEQLADMSFKLQAAIEGKDINSPELANVFLMVINSVRYHIGGLDEKTAIFKFQELVRRREEMETQKIASEQLEN
ncbi:MAG: hypothetical protein J5502_05095 [Prevotella sp.]|nr:hypothetical protein [Prevotella sp.]